MTQYVTATSEVCENMNSRMAGSGPGELRSRFDQVDSFVSEWFASQIRNGSAKIKHYGSASADRSENNAAPLAAPNNRVDIDPTVPGPASISFYMLEPFEINASVGDHGAWHTHWSEDVDALIQFARELSLAVRDGFYEEWIQAEHPQNNRVGLRARYKSSRDAEPNDLRMNWSDQLGIVAHMKYPPYGA